MGNSLSNTRTGKQPASNGFGLQGNRLAPANPRGLKASLPMTVMATGSGGKKASARGMGKRTTKARRTSKRAFGL